jgi:hypothetical protein
MYVRKRVVNIVRIVMEFGEESVLKRCDGIQFEYLIFSIIFQNTWRSEYIRHLFCWLCERKFLL